MRVCNGARRRRSTASSACGGSALRRRGHRLRSVTVSHPWIKRVQAVGVGDAGRTLTLALALGGAGGRDRGES